MKTKYKLSIIYILIDVYMNFVNSSVRGWLMIL